MGALNDGALNGGAGPIDQHLDEMFDRLAGTGAQGRRLLVEVEDHLRTAAEEGRARGLEVVAAEQEAVARFGSPAAVLAPVAGVTVRLFRVALGAWTISGIALVVAGVAGLVGHAVAYGFTQLLWATDGLGVVDVADLCRNPAILQPVITCTPGSNALSPDRLLAAVPTVEVALLSLVVGAAMAVVDGVLRRLGGEAGWLPPRRVITGTVTVLCGMAAALLLPWSVFEAMAGPWSQLSGHLAAALTTLAVAVVGWRHHRRAGRRVGA